jgi:hypothetical protein
MLEVGAQEKWPAKYCERKWEELHPETVTASTNNAPATQAGAIQLGVSTAPSQDAWISQDQGSEFEYGQSTPSIPMISRSPVTFTTPVISRSPIQRSPGPIKHELNFEA